MIASQPLYKVKFGFGPDDYIHIYAKELLKLHLCIHKNAFFTGELGDVDASKVIAVRADHKATYGCEQDYRLTLEDFDEITAKHGNIDSYVGLADVTAKEYLSSGREQEILDGRVKLKQLSKPTSRTYGTKKIGDIL